MSVHRRGLKTAPEPFSLAKPRRARRRQGGSGDRPRLRQTKLDFSAAVGTGSSPVKAQPTCRLAEVQQLLTSRTPTSLPGREAEQDAVATFVREAVTAGACGLSCGSACGRIMMGGLCLHMV